MYTKYKIPGKSAVSTASATDAISAASDTAAHVTHAGNARRAGAAVFTAFTLRKPLISRFSRFCTPRTGLLAPSEISSVSARLCGLISPSLGPNNGHGSENYQIMIRFFPSHFQAQITPPKALPSRIPQSAPKQLSLSPPGHPRPQSTKKHTSRHPSVHPSNSPTPEHCHRRSGRDTVYP